jgi:F0F1-type ATP synthase membrane subunit b/b'
MKVSLFGLFFALCINLIILLAIVCKFLQGQLLKTFVERVNCKILAVRAKHDLEQLAEPLGFFSH